jgi:acyl carrier protein
LKRSEVRALVSDIIEGPCPDDDAVVEMTSLQQLEFGFAIEEALDYRQELPEDMRWRTIGDVVTWLKEKGELTT